MTSERLLNAIAAFLRTKVEDAGGVFSLSETVANTLSLLGGSAGRFRVILQWQQEQPTGNRGEEEMTFLVIVQQGGPNLGVNPGDAITVSRPSALSALTADSDGPLTVDSDRSNLNNAPLMQRCTQFYKALRSLKFTNPDINQQMPHCAPGRAYWLNDSSLPTRQIAKEFKVRFANDATTAETLTVP